MPRAAQERGVSVPIAIDNNRAISSGSRVRQSLLAGALLRRCGQGACGYHRFGEGNYEESGKGGFSRNCWRPQGEQRALSERQSVSFEAHGPEVGADWGNLKSPETYVGHQQSREVRISWRCGGEYGATSMRFRLACASINGRCPAGCTFKAAGGPRGTLLAGGLPAGSTFYFISLMGLPRHAAPPRVSAPTIDGQPPGSSPRNRRRWTTGNGSAVESGCIS